MKQALLVALVICGCGGAQEAPEKPKEPGLYGDPYYGCSRSESCPTNGLNATVGLPFTASPYANCEGGDWSTTVSLETGELPPGLVIDSAGTISGVPQLAGNWNFSLRFSSITCAGSTYADTTASIQIVAAGDSTYGY